MGGGNGKSWGEKMLVYFIATKRAESFAGVVGEDAWRKYFEEFFVVSHSFVFVEQFEFIYFGISEKGVVSYDAKAIVRNNEIVKAVGSFIVVIFDVYFGFFEVNVRSDRMTRSNYSDWVETVESVREFVLKEEEIGFGIKSERGFWAVNNVYIIIL